MKPITVTQLNSYISRVLSTDPLLYSVLVEGEVSGMKYHSAGYAFFSLIDDNSSVRCFMPNEAVETAGTILKDGMQVQVRGNINVYKKGGYYSIYVREVEEKGAGARAEAFEKLKAKLLKEGLFDKSRKKPLPFFPEKIAVVTSATGAAVHDILKIIKSRNDHVSVYIFPVNVQGEYAAGQISETIELINKRYPDIDIIIEGRGGGSAEDLSCFNDEGLARAIAASDIPVISAVGHEVDYTISDMAADVRAETPTAAAQIAVPDTSELRDRINELKDGMMRQLEEKHDFEEMKLDGMKNQLAHSLETEISGYESEVERLGSLIRSYDPRAILSRGYAVVEDKDGHVVMKASQLSDGDSMDITLAEGSVSGVVTQR
jgi:exodeoxyribonuclease VII large subunit